MCAVCVEKTQLQKRLVFQSQNLTNLVRMNEKYIYPGIFFERVYKRSSLGCKFSNSSQSAVRCGFKLHRRSDLKM